MLRNTTESTPPMPKTYRVTNRITKECYILHATSAQSAAEALGWLIGDCYVKELPRVRRDLWEAPF